MYIYIYIVNSTTLYLEESLWGTKATVVQANSGEKTETQCWLYDKYGHLARNCRLRNFRLISIYKDDDHMYSVDRRLEPRVELLWEGRRVCGVVTCSTADPTRSQ